MDDGHRRYINAQPALTFYAHVDVVPTNARCPPDARVGHDHCHGLVVHVADNVMPDLHKMAEVVECNIVLQERTEVRNRLVDDDPGGREMPRRL